MGNEALKFLVGLVMATGTVVSGHFLMKALLSRDSRTYTGERNWQSWHGKLYLAMGAIGWVAVIAFGLHGVLKLCIPPWGDTRVTLAVLGALATLPLAEHLEKLPRMRKDYAVLSTTVSWLEENLERGYTPTEYDLKQALEQSRDTTTPLVERHAMGYRHQMLLSLKARDARVEAAVLARQELERAHAVAEAARTQAAAVKAEQEAAKQAELLEQCRRAELLIATRVKSEPLVESLDQAPSRGVIAQDAILDLWRSFKASIVNRPDFRGGSFV